MKVPTTRLLLVTEIWDGKPSHRKSLARNLLVWSDLTFGPLLQGQMRTAKLKSAYNSLYPQTKVGDILDSGPSRRRRRRNFLVDAITQKPINIFFFKLGTHVKDAQRKIPILR